MKLSVKEIVLVVMLMLQTSAATGLQSIEGYSAVPFGADLETVQRMAADLGLGDISVQKEEGYDVVRAVVNKSSDLGALAQWGDSSLVFVINAQSNQLGLIIQHYTELLTDRMVIKELTKLFGLPMDETAKKLIYEQVKKEFPENLQRITVWADHQGGNSEEGITASRFIRVLYFGNYVSVEYLDTDIL